MSSNVWFTSDLHLGHDKVAALRGFGATSAHDLALAQMWHSLVKPGDQVWVLGDVALGDPTYALMTLAELPGEKHLVWGNHDQGHPMYRNAHRKAAVYTARIFGGIEHYPAAAFASVQPFARRKIEGQQVLLSHFPYIGDTPGRTEDRHTQYRLPNEGLSIIHGHEHSESQLTWAMWDRLDNPAPQIHVGLDAWGLRLVNLDEVAALLRESGEIEEAA